jgi:hypothetical protein
MRLLPECGRMGRSIYATLEAVPSDILASGPTVPREPCPRGMPCRMYMCGRDGRARVDP